MVIRFIQDVQLGVDTLIMHKLRSCLTILGVVFGVASVIAMLAVGEGAGKEALDRIRQLGSTLVILDSAKPTEDTRSASVHTFMSVYGLLYEDDRRIRETFQHVRRTAPAKVLLKEARVGARRLDVRLIGTTVDWPKLLPRPVLAGRHLSEGDMVPDANVAVLTETVARGLMVGTPPLGQKIRLEGNVYMVVGVVRAKGMGSVQTPDQQSDVYIPLPVAKAHFGDIAVRHTAGAMEREKVELHQLVIDIDTDQHVESTAAGIAHMLKRFHKKDDYRINVPLTLLNQAKATRRTFSIVLSAIAGISLLVGGIGIMNIMLASVSERTREIGIRRAIGAPRAQIVRQFLIETVVLSTTGGLVGIAVGVAIPWGITRFTAMPTVVTPLSLILSLAISVGVGVVFGMYPAVRAANLDPIQALRHE